MIQTSDFVIYIKSQQVMPLILVIAPTDHMGGSTFFNNSVRGLSAGGYTPAKVTAIEFVTIASTGNAQIFW